MLNGKSTVLGMHRIKFRNLTLMLLALSLLGSAYRTVGQSSPSAEGPRYRIIGYVTGRAEIHRISAERLTHLNYAFARISESGEIILRNQGSPAHLAQLQALKAKNPN